MSNKNNSYLIPITIIGILFFIFGFVTWLNATLIPYLKIACQLTNFQAFWVTFAFYISYGVMALPSSAILRKTGFKNGMSLGLIVMAIGALIFIPAAYSRSFGVFLVGLFVQAIGLTLLQTASNPYVTILGPIESAAKRISIMGIANKVAGIISPAIMGAIVLKNADKIEANLLKLSPANQLLQLDAMAQRVVTPYLIMAGVLFILAFAIRLSTLPKISDEINESGKTEESRKSIFSYPYLILGALAIFFYVGVEVIAVDSLINYGKYLGFELARAKYFSSFTLIAMVIGYFFGIVTIPRFLKQENALKYFAILGLIFSLGAIYAKASGSITFIALLGFANSIMWPTIWPLAISGLGKHTKTGSALLIMGITGGAILPLVYAGLSEMKGLNDQIAYMILLPGYLYILFYAAYGHKIGKTLKK
jgi:FHS family L-fucose permease-like MFS transporter